MKGSALNIAQLIAALRKREYFADAISSTCTAVNIIRQVEESPMDITGECGRMTIGPKRRDSQYDESTDEPAPLIEKEVTDIEKEKPADDTEPVEQVEDQEGTAPPAFEE